MTINLEDSRRKDETRSEDLKEEGSDWLQIVAILSACSGSITGGIMFTWPAQAGPKIVNDKVNYDISEDEASYFSVWPPVGQILTCLIFSKLIDVLGRKRTLLLVAIPHIISWFLIGTTKSISIFYLARFISGMGDAGLFATVPVYIGEIATPKVRGTWGNAFIFSLYVGQVLSNFIGSFCSVTLTAGISVIVPIFFVCTFINMPESPYFYVMQGKLDAARQSLQVLRRKRNVEMELEELMADVARQMSESGSWSDLVTIKSNRKAIYTGIFLRVSQQLAGIGTFAVYTRLIFEKAGGNVSPTVSTLIYSVLCASLNLVAGFTFDKIEKRRIYFCSCLGCGIVLLCLAISLMIPIQSSIFNWIPITGMVLYIICYSFGLGIVPTSMLSVLFSTSIKGKALCLLNIVFAMLVLSVTKIGFFLTTSIGLHSMFLLFSTCCFISTFLSLYFVPETKGKTLEEMQQSLKKSRKTQNITTICNY